VCVRTLAFVETILTIRSTGSDIHVSTLKFLIDKPVGVVGGFVVSGWVGSADGIVTL